MAAEEKEATAAESAIAEIQKKITDAFEVFDHECNKTVDVREIGTIIRSLGCCPSEGDLHDMLAEVEEEEPTGFIRLEKFLPMMTRILMERRYRPIPEDILLRAFEVLDQNKCGHLTKDELIKYMTEEGTGIVCPLQMLLRCHPVQLVLCIHGFYMVPGAKPTDTSFCRQNTFYTCVISR
ncbi:dynein regulatory complex protein 8 isoform X1 [Anolis carolinensis]|uniref:dynein regulatory complex protein 8 isoform X1 n=1 Tax=Anolis carolinensis TaxID=28377 RepID=UPI002F2B448B